MRRALETLPGLTVAELTAELADGSARRASTGLPLPAAVMLATAQRSAASLLTNDRGLVHPAGPVPVLVLDDEMGLPGAGGRPAE